MKLQQDALNPASLWGIFTQQLVLIFIFSQFHCFSCPPPLFLQLFPFFWCYLHFCYIFYFTFSLPCMDFSFFFILSLFLVSFYLRMRKISTSNKIVFIKLIGNWWIKNRSSRINHQMMITIRLVLYLLHENFVLYHYGVRCNDHDKTLLSSFSCVLFIMFLEL